MEQNSCKLSVKQITAAQRAFFATGVTKDISWRLGALEALKQGILALEDEINEALCTDLNKSAFESYMTEVGMVLSELSHTQKHLKKWAKDKKVPTPLGQFSAKSFISSQPYGIVLVMAPWNYPFQLAIAPVIGAIAAGNCVIIKPSQDAPATSAIIAKLISNCFEPEFAAVVEGGIEESTALLEEHLDFVFFTGGAVVGKIVMEKASKHLTPVCLELGGKSPCIVDQTANLTLAAKRIVFGKFLNAGQTCVAPDYLFVHQAVKDQLVTCIKEAIVQFFGKRPMESPGYGKIINEKHFNRLLKLMQDEHVASGGGNNPKTLQIEPTLLDGISADSPIMQQEIFGPLLPIMTFQNLSEAAEYINAHDKPLALYLFTTDKKAEQYILNECSFGGGCINDTIIHLATSELPFGGVGQSGLGSYHGRQSFETFSHHRSIVKKHNFIDLPIRYRPYTPQKEKMLRKFLK